MKPLRALFEIPLHLLSAFKQSRRRVRKIDDPLHARKMLFPHAGQTMPRVGQCNHFARMLHPAPLCFGFLTGAIRRDTVFLPGDHRHGWPRAQLDNWIDGAGELLASVDATPGLEGVHSALRFCLSFPAVSSVIPGILTSREAVENAAASDLGALPQAAIDAVLDINRKRQFYVAPARAS